MKRREVSSTGKVTRRNVWTVVWVLAVVLVLCGTMLLMRRTARALEEDDLAPGSTASTAETAAPEIAQGTETTANVETDQAQPAVQSSAADEPAPATAETAQEDSAETPDVATAETAQGALEPGDKVAVAETLKFATEDVSILVKVSGEATVAEEAAQPPEDAQMIVAEPADEAETAETAAAADEAEPAALALSAEETAPETDAAETTPTTETELEVAALPESQPEYKQAVAYIEQSADDDGVLMVSAMRFDFYYQGQPLDVSNCEVTAEVRPTETLMDEARAEAAEKQAEADAAAEAAVQTMAEDGEEVEQPETRQGVEFVALQSGADEAERLDSAFIEADTQETPVLTAALQGANPVVMLAARETTNPTFTVQYYANLKVTKRNDSGYLTIIDTDNGGQNKGGKLPENGAGTETTGLYLKDLGNGKREIQTDTQLTELYSANEYSYFAAPGLPYVNIFRDNGNYTANEVWILKDGKDPASMEEADWAIIQVTDPSTIRFTNDPNDEGLKKPGNKVILIEDGTVLRLVANQTTGSYDNAATFYDYDITDDGKTTWDSTFGQHGINSGSNYSGSGAKLAFGNANTGTGLQNENWNNNTLNQYNHMGNSLQGCTFGLVTGLDENGHIQYANGVVAPDLFDEGGATGKTTYSNWSLGFNRMGDTYILTSVNDGTTDVTTGLEYFNNPQTGETVYSHIWTNNFWPMDSHPGDDGLTGNYMDRGEFSGYNGVKLYPCSDDGLDHNNMFGMQYELEFTLTEDYIGPLEYYFFGDDDMWVFLDGRLVCDIGGVHSSVGAYVNLWDYIAKGSAGTHTLKFYYTERGLSGSTCYMQFTLPSVSQVPPTYQNAQLKILKQVVGDSDSNKEFDFTINIQNKDGSTPASVYLIERYDAQGNRVEEEKPSLIQNGTGTFKLRANEYAIIRYLQYGTKYTITETSSPGYTVTTVVDSRVNTQPVVLEKNTTWTASGTVEEGNNSNVTFINTVRPKLPDTGGTGVVWYTTGGAVMLLAACAVLYRRRRAR